MRFYVSALDGGGSLSVRCGWDGAQASAERALARDREPLNGRPTFLSPFVNARAGERPVGVRHPTGPSDTTVYASNLPFQWTDQQLHELFRQVGWAARGLARERTTGDEARAVAQRRASDRARGPAAVGHSVARSSRCAL